jgi:hypothetical protein
MSNYLDLLTVMSYPILVLYFIFRSQGVNRPSSKPTKDSIVISDQLLANIELEFSVISLTIH